MAKFLFYFFIVLISFTSCRQEKGSQIVKTTGFDQNGEPGVCKNCGEGYTCAVPGCAGDGNCDLSMSDEECKKTRKKFEDFLTLCEEKGEILHCNLSCTTLCSINVNSLK